MHDRSIWSAGTVSISIGSIKRKLGPALEVTVDKACSCAISLHRRGSLASELEVLGQHSGGGARSETRPQAPVIEVRGGNWCKGWAQRPPPGITAWSRTGPRRSSTRRSPWIWEGSGPGPRRRGSHPGGSRPGEAACLNQDGPGEQRHTHTHTHQRKMVEPGAHLIKGLLLTP